MDSRLRSRTVSCTVGSIPAAAAAATPASGDMCAEAVGLSVRLTASIEPTSATACSRTGSSDPPAGGTISPVTVNAPRAKSPARWAPTCVVIPA